MSIDPKDLDPAIRKELGIDEHGHPLPLPMGGRDAEREVERRCQAKIEFVRLSELRDTTDSEEIIGLLRAAFKEPEHGPTEEPEYDADPGDGYLRTLPVAHVVVTVDEHGRLLDCLLYKENPATGNAVGLPIARLPIYGLEEKYVMKEPSKRHLLLHSERVTVNREASTPPRVRAVG